jgi:L-lysine 2,3-aminomutase
MLLNFQSYTMRHWLKLQLRDYMKEVAESELASSWQKQLATAVSSYSELMTTLQLDHRQSDAVAAAGNDFALRVPRAFVKKMQPANRRDPLLLQVVPDAAEMIVTPGYSKDPLQEATSMPAPGLLHKYQGRVLLTLVGACAVNCRYCFRRHYPYSDRIPNQDFKAALDYIAADKSIREVILSGGDPLLLKDAQLQKLFDKIASIEHIKVLRIHSRMPVVLPARVDASFINLMSSNAHLKKVLVLHANHPNEIDADFAVRMRALADAGVQLLNQAVLLQSVNDNAQVLHDLSWSLFSAGVLPYYLHQMDAVVGAAHFNVPLAKARVIYKKLQAMLPGYLCPRWVVETPGAANKELCD